MPDFGSWRGIDLTITFLNLTGVFIGGIASQLATHGGANKRIAEAFNGGFVAAYTSFCFFVEHTADLTVKHKDGSHIFAIPYLLMCFILGPVGFELGKQIGAIVFPTPATPLPDCTD